METVSKIVFEVIGNHGDSLSLHDYIFLNYFIFRLCVSFLPVAAKVILEKSLSFI
jgi:hypothetical protein